jgi:hypothetical protein
MDSTRLTIYAASILLIGSWLFLVGVYTAETRRGCFGRDVAVQNSTFLTTENAKITKEFCASAGVCASVLLYHIMHLYGRCGRHGRHGRIAGRHRGSLRPLRLTADFLTTENAKIAEEFPCELAASSLRFCASAGVCASVLLYHIMQLYGGCGRHGRHGRIAGRHRGSLRSLRLKADFLTTENAKITEEFCASAGVCASVLLYHIMRLYGRCGRHGRIAGRHCGSLRSLRLTPDFLTTENAKIAEEFPCELATSSLRLCASLCMHLYGRCGRHGRHGRIAGSQVQINWDWNWRVFIP